MKEIEAIIWDYNGTLLDDIDIGIQSINEMLGKRGLPLLTKQSYREVFTFPVIDYYKEIGFDFQKECWDKTAHEFIDNYNKRLHKSRIFPQAIDLLAHFNDMGKRQFILSAMEHEMLTQSTQDESITHFFEEISGIDNIYASSKIENGKNLIRRNNLNPHRVCLLGDTSHDYQVAQELGCQCILIADGHQSFSKLVQTGCPQVIESLRQISPMKENYSEISNINH